jgi:TetR/AcrR family mexXY operon transcriptional repressor
MARKTKEATLETVSAILDSAEAVFVRHGVAKATIEQIANGAGVSKGAVYGHFKDKIEVCVAVCARALEPLSQITSPARENETHLETLFRWGVDYMGLYFESPAYRNVGEILYVKCENSPEFESIQRIRTLWENRAFRATGILLRKAIAAGELPADSDARLGNIYLHTILDGLICAYYYTPRLNDLERKPLVENLLRMGIAGLKAGGSL